MNHLAHSLRRTSPVSLRSLPLLLVLFFSRPARAVDYTLTGGAFPGGDPQLWVDPINWSPAGVPGPGDSVTIPNVTFGVTPPASGVTVDRLNIVGGRLDPGGTLTVTQGGTLNGATIECVLNYGAGAVTNLAGNNSLLAEPGAINNAGTINMNGISLSAGATVNAIIFNNSGTLVFSGNEGFGGRGAGTINNTGTIRRLVAPGQTVLGYGILHNNGFVDVQGGTLFVQGSQESVSISRGRFNAASGATISLSNTNTFQNARFTGAGKTECVGALTDGSVIVGGGLFPGLPGPGNLLLAGTAIGNLTVSTRSTGVVTLNTAATGTLNITENSRVDLLGLSLPGGGTINNRGTFNMKGGTILSAPGNGPSTFNNFGTLVLSGGDGMGDAPRARKLSNINNTGVIRKTASTVSSSFGDAVLNNNGLVDVQGGVFAVTGEPVSVSRGTFNVADSALIQMQNRNTFQNAHFTGGGRTELIGSNVDGTVAVGTAPAGDGDFLIRGATVVGTLTITTAGTGAAAGETGLITGVLNVPVGSTFGMRGIAFGEHGTVNNRGTINTNGFGYTGNNTAFNNFGTLNFSRGASVGFLRGLTIPKLTNSGTINLDPAGPATYGLTVDFAQTSTGRLNIKVGGTAQGTQHDFFSVNTAALGGALNVDLINNFVPQAGQDFHVLRYSSHTGQFASVNGPFRPVYSATEMVLEGLDRALLLSVTPSTFSEGAGPAAATGRVTRIGATSSPLTVALRSSDTGEATVPATVVIPAGAASTSFHVAAVDDQVVDGPQQVTITARATGLPDAVETVTVTDNDVPRLQLTLSPQTFSEDAGPSATVGTITRNTLTTGAQTVNLSSSDPAEVTVPATVTIPVGATSATFRIAAINDTLTDGPHAVTITASADGFIASAARVSVTDSVRLLRLSITPTGFADNAGANAATGTVTRSPAAPSALTVTLTSSDTGAATVPATVTIPAGAASVTFPVAAVDDNLLNGSRGVTIRASAFGFVPSGVGLTVLDNELGLRANLSVSTATAYAKTGLITLRFTAPLDSTSASDTANYTVTVDGQQLAIELVNYDSRRNTVIIGLAHGSLRSNDVVTVACHNLRDAHGRIVSMSAGPFRVR